MKNYSEEISSRSEEMPADIGEMKSCIKEMETYNDANPSYIEEK